jgi:hypothetical protein
MFSLNHLLTLLLVLGAVYTQTSFPGTCSNNSLIPRLATGTINLNPVDTYNNGANKDFYRDLSPNQFLTTDVLGYAFAISGFQTNCSQTYYTLVVDKVYF